MAPERLTNWAGNYRFRAAVHHHPATLDELAELIRTAAEIRVVGSRHSFTDIADAAEIVSLDRLPAEIATDPERATVTVRGAVGYGELARQLEADGLALANLASLPHISVAGALATATHGSGTTAGNLACGMAAIDLVRADGELMTLRRGDADFPGAAVHLGALGVVTAVTLDVEPTYEVSQRVYEGLAWPALLEHFDAIMAAGDSVSVFTRWGPQVDQVWVKRRVRPGAGSEPDALFGARPARVKRHPIVELDAVHCTEQLGRPGPWLDRLPHFRLGFTPSSGNELQSEYHLDRAQTIAGLQAVRRLAATLTGLVQISEVRTIAADGLWLSPQYGRATVAIHFTWAPRPRAVADAVRELEQALLPLGARPHWGKLFAASAAELAGAYPRARDFATLALRLDPRGVFVNAWMRRHVPGFAG